MPTTREHRAARREELVRAAIDVLSAKGWSETRIADIAQQVGISPGHVLYYFESKLEIFLAAVAVIERDFRDEVLQHTADIPTAQQRWDYLIDHAAPTGPGDFRLMLWLQAWELSPRDPYVATQVQEHEDRWIAMLRDTLRSGVESGELEVDDLDGFALRFSALMDGLWIQVVVGSPHIDREVMLDACRRYAESELRWRDANPSGS